MKCKVVCSFKQPYDDSFYLYFNFVYKGSPENERFFKYTPGGVCNLNIVNAETAAKFEVGKEYYIDFSPAE